jgi:hypothetical protein
MSPAAPHPGDQVAVVTGRRAPAGGGRSRQRGTSTRRRIVERLLVAAIAALVLTAALSNMGGTYAYWSDESQLSAGTLETGSASLEATLLVPEEPLHAGNLLPGDAVPHEVTLENTGDVPLAVSVTATGTIAGIAHPLEVGSGDTAASVVPASLMELGVGESRTVSLEVVAPTALGPDDQMDITLHFEGEQIR